MAVKKQLNPLGSLMYGWCLLLLLTLQVLPVKLSPLTVYIDSNVTFACSLPTNSNTTLIWEHRGRDLRQRTISVGSSLQGEYKSSGKFYTVNSTELTILAVSKEDQGVYTCTKFIQGGTQSWTLQVAVIPGDPVLKETKVAEEGGVYIVECSVYGGDPQPIISWSLSALDGTHISLETAIVNTYTNDTGHFVSKLAIVVSRQLQGAYFSCNVYQPGFESKYNHTVRQKVTKARYAPLTPVIRGGNITLVEGKTHSFTCSANYANPAANVSWFLVYKDGSEVRLNTTIEEVFYENGYYRTESEVYLNITSDMDQTTLNCSTTNEVMLRNGELSLASPTLLQVDYRPVVNIGDTSTNKSNGTSITEGSKLTISCLVVDAKPTADSITWYHNKNFVEVNNQEYSTYGTLPLVHFTISSVSRNNRGSWQCHSSNYVGEGVSDTYTVDVLHRPVCLPNQDRVKYASAVGVGIDMRCRVAANPTLVDFSWRKAGTTQRTKLLGKTSTGFTVYSDYYIVPRTQEDYGEYECFAENSQGIIDTPCIVELHLPGPAEAPTDCKIFNRSLTSLKIACIPTFDGGSLATYALQLLKDNKFVTLSNQSVPLFNVTQLTESTNYTFKVCASNSEYWSTRDCSPQFTGGTESRYVLDGKFEDVTPSAASYSAVTLSTAELYVIVAVSCVTLVTITVVIAIMCYKRANSKSAASDIKQRQDAITDFAVLTNTTRRQSCDEQMRTAMNNTISNESGLSGQYVSTSALRKYNYTPIERSYLPSEHDAATAFEDRKHVKPSLCGEQQDQSYLMEDIKENIRTGKLSIPNEEDEDGATDPNKMPMSLL